MHGIDDMHNVVHLAGNRVTELRIEIQYWIMPVSEIIAVSEIQGTGLAEEYAQTFAVVNASDHIIHAVGKRTGINLGVAEWNIV